MRYQVSPVVVPRGTSKSNSCYVQAQSKAEAAKKAMKLHPWKVASVEPAPEVKRAEMYTAEGVRVFKKDLDSKIKSLREEGSLE